MEDVAGGTRPPGRWSGAVVAVWGGVPGSGGPRLATRVPADRLPPDLVVMLYATVTAILGQIQSRHTSPATRKDCGPPAQTNDHLRGRPTRRSDNWRPTRRVGNPLVGGTRG